MTIRTILGLFCALILFSGTAANPAVAAGDSFVQGWSPYEDEVIFDRKPTISWLIAPGGSKVVSFEMQLDGKKVEARFDEASSEIIYKPAQDLALGKHMLYATVTFDDGNIYEISPVSTFIIQKSQAESTGFDPYKNRNKALLQKHERAEIEVVNKLRASLGLPPVERVNALSFAAQTHSNYLEINHLLDHYQQRNKPGFIGESPSDRAEFFGYSGGVAEDASSDPGVFSGLQGLIDAPYHRLPFIERSVSFIGIGHSEEATVINFGYGQDTHQAQAVMYPYPGQTDVSPSWHDTEIPSPLADFGEERSVVGYPIMLSVGGNGIDVQSAQLTDERGREVPFYNVDANENNDYVLLISKEPLNDGASYTVSIKGTYDEEDTIKKFHKKWLFTTESYGRSAGLTPAAKMSIHLNGKPLSLKQQPIVVNGASLLPLRTIFESLGATIEWDGATRTVTASKPGTELGLQIGSYIATVNGKEVMLDNAARLYNGSAMIPVRFVSESFGAKVVWDKQRNAVLITL
jgi:hypothetical protein